ncbi:hypothetical protein K8R61_01460, partial [bacterium]|nr:hypothetical protein [bacterium]
EKELKKLLKIKGMVRGSVLKTDLKYVLDKKGEEGIKKIKKEIKKILPAFNYDEIKNTNWYPVGWRALSLLIIIKTFNWSEEEIFKMGQAAPKNSFIARTILRFFVSLKKTVEEIPKYWRKHYSVGKMVNKKIDIKNKIIITCLKDFNIHPCLFNYFRGYFHTITELATRSNDVTIEETEVSSKENSYRKFTIRWK